MEYLMTASVPAPKSRILSAHRLVLLAGIAGLGTTLLIGGAGFLPQPTNSDLSAVAYAQGVERPVGFANIVEKVKPAVISVRVKVAGGATMMGFEGDSPLPPNVERFFRRFGLPEGLSPEQPRTSPRERLVTGQGSGFFISADGYAVTNNHVVDKASTVQVTADDGKTYTAKVIGTDPRTDIALIKVDGRGDFPYVRLAEKSPRIGDWVLAVGNPFGLGGTVTAGIVSARGRDIGAGPYDDFLQIDAPVNRGNSGGPTFDTQGNVVGVNTAIYSPSGGSVGIGFAIPAEVAKDVVASLKDKGTVARGWIGVQIQPVSPEIADSLNLKGTKGALVAETQSGSPAASAGLKSGDVIVGVNGDKIDGPRELARRIAALGPEKRVDLTYLRDGSEHTANVRLGTLPAEKEAAVSAPETTGRASLANLGLSLAPASSVSGAKEGVVVTEVDPDGIAAQKGLKSGDIILEAAGRPVSRPAEISSALDAAKKAGRKAVLLRVKSGDQTRFVALATNPAS